MLSQIPLESLLRYITPGGDPSHFPRNLFGAGHLGAERKESGAGSDRIGSEAKNAQRTFRRTLSTPASTTDSSFEDMIRAVGVLRGIPEEEILQALVKLQMMLEGYSEKRYPLGIFGFISEELLPIFSDLLWLKPTLDHEIQLTVTANNSSQTISRCLNILAESDAANTRSGSWLLENARNGSSSDQRVYFSGLCLLTLFQFASALFFGPNRTEDELRAFAALAGNGGARSANERWFLTLQERLGVSTWTSIDHALRAALKQETNIADTGSGSRMHLIRSGRKAMRYDQCTALLIILSNHQTSDVCLSRSDAQWLETAYRIAVLRDNFVRRWHDSESHSVDLPDLDLEDALIHLYTQARRRSEASTGRPHL